MVNKKKVIKKPEKGHIELATIHLVCSCGYDGEVSPYNIDKYASGCSCCGHDIELTIICPNCGAKTEF
jgi:hypothetical protein